MENKKILERLLAKASGKGPVEILHLAKEEFGKSITFASSLGEEDQVITDMIERNNLAIPIFTLDTGRLFDETYQLIAQTQKKYPNIKLTIFFPDAAEVEAMVNAKGINLFYGSVENRKLCCHIRKVKPLQRALAGKKAWICGLRRDQAVTRIQVEPFEWDENNAKYKVNPLALWSIDEVRAYIREYQVPINPLHEKSFISIGCAPCTRAIKPGEDIRAGRWWWEQPEHKECGLHGRKQHD